MLLLGLLKFLPDPDDVVGSDYDQYRKLLDDPHLYAVVQQRKGQITQLGWEVVNYTDSDGRYKEILSVLRRLEFQKIIGEMLNALLLGYSVLEINWKRKEDRIIPIDIIEKPQEWFGFDNENEIKLRKSFGELENLPRMKFLLCQHNATYNNPYGEKLLKKVYWIVNQKEIAGEMWQKLAERYGLPQLIGRYPSTATQADIDRLLENVEKMIEDNITVMSESDQIEYSESAKYNVGETYERLMDYYNAEISKAFLTVTLTTELRRTGSYKAAEIHKEMLEYIGMEDKKLVEKAFNTMLSWYADLNWSPNEKRPRIKLERKERIIESSVDRDQKLREMGVVFSKEYYKKRYNLDEGDFVLQ